MRSQKRKPSIFISHSSKDIAIARGVRNLLEDREHFVGFFGWLQEMTDEEIETFLKSEIRKHDWLILIDTENATSSHWVQIEIEEAKHRQKPLYAIDAHRFVGHNRQEIENNLSECVNTLSRGLRTFLTYSRADSVFASLLDKVLWESGFENFIDKNDLEVGDDWHRQITNAIDETLEHGVFIPIISNKSIASKFFLFELQYALEQVSETPNIIILPIIIEKVDFSLLPQEMLDFQFLELNQGKVNNDTSIQKVLDLLEKRRREIFAQRCGHIIE